jgi:hypothetical protein
LRHECIELRASGMGIVICRGAGKIAKTASMSWEEWRVYGEALSIESASEISQGLRRVTTAMQK